MMVLNSYDSWCGCNDRAGLVRVPWWQLSAAIASMQVDWDACGTAVIACIIVVSAALHGYAARWLAHRYPNYTYHILADLFTLFSDHWICLDQTLHARYSSTDQVVAWLPLSNTSVHHPSLNCYVRNQYPFFATRSARGIFIVSS